MNTFLANLIQLHQKMIAIFFIFQETYINASNRQYEEYKNSCVETAD